MYSKVANFILSNKHNTALAGEKHQVIYLPDGTYNPSVYSGPGTNLEVRLKRGDEPLSAVDKIAQAHDIRYLLANTEDDVKKADETMINKLNDVRARKLDSNFNINQAELIRLKYYANKLGVPTSFFTSFGHGDSQAEQDLIPIAEKKLEDLQQSGYGKVRPKRLYKDDKGYYNKNSNSGVKQYLKTGDNRSGRDLYIINMNNPKAVSKPRTKKPDEGDKSKLTKMIPSDIKSSGSSSSSPNTGVPSSKQDVINAYNEGINVTSKQGVNSYNQGLNRARMDSYKELLDKYKELQNEIRSLLESDPDKIKLKEEQDVVQLSIDNFDIPANERQQAEYENLSNYSEDMTVQTVDLNQPSLLRPPPSVNGSDMTLQNIPVNPDGTPVNNQPSAPELPSQPVIEPIIETEGVSPFDNTNDFNSISAIEVKLGRQIKDQDTQTQTDEGAGVSTQTEEEGGVEEQKVDLSKRDLLKQEAEGKDMSFEDLASGRTLNPLSEPVESKPPPSSSKKTKYTNLSQIKAPIRRIKILLGEADLTPKNRDFLQGFLDRFINEGRQKVTDDFLPGNNDREEIDKLWKAYTIPIKIAKKNEKEIIDRYLNQVGFGIRNIDREGLTTSHIEDMMKKYDHINLSVIASNEILSLKKGLNSDTQLLPFIMNLDPSDKPGSHWVAVVIDNRDKYVGYYDSLCIHPTKQILDDIKELVKSVDPVHMFKFKFNTIRDQSKNSGKCGMYSMQFLHNILNGMSFKKASGYYDRDFEDNEDKLVKTFKYI